MQRLFLLFAGLCGVAGVGLMAAGSHGSAQPLLATAGTLLAIHAPALLAIGLADPERLPGAIRPAGLVLAFGAGLFAVDLTVRAYAGAPLFPYAAPAGGTLVIAGWLLVIVAAAMPKRR